MQHWAYAALNASRSASEATLGWVTLTITESSWIRKRVSNAIVKVLVRDVREMSGFIER